jgi:histidine triad (HIT) family protein
MQDSIFTKIAKGESPCFKVYEDELTMAFMNINPVHTGHLLVITKQQVEFVWDLPDDLYHALMKTVKKVAVRMREVMPERYIHMGISGTDVPHVHVHLIPFNSEDDFKGDENTNPDMDEIKAIAEKLRF